MAIKLSLMINDTDLDQIVKLVAHRASSEKLRKNYERLEFDWEFNEKSEWKML